MHPPIPYRSHIKPSTLFSQELSGSQLSKYATVVNSLPERCYTGSGCKSEQQESSRQKHAQRMMQGKCSAAADANQSEWQPRHREKDEAAADLSTPEWLDGGAFTAQEQHLVSDRQNYNSCWGSVSVLMSNDTHSDLSVPWLNKQAVLKSTPFIFCCSVHLFFFMSSPFYSHLPSYCPLSCHVSKRYPLWRAWSRVSERENNQICCWLRSLTFTERLESEESRREISEQGRPKRYWLIMQWRSRVTMNTGEKRAPLSELSRWYGHTYMERETVMRLIWRTCGGLGLLKCGGGSSGIRHKISQC